MLLVLSAHFHGGEDSGTWGGKQQIELHDSASGQQYPSSMHVLPMQGLSLSLQRFIAIHVWEFGSHSKLKVVLFGGQQVLPWPHILSFVQHPRPVVSQGICRLQIADPQ